MATLADAYVRIRPETSGLDASGISKPAAEMGRKAGEEAGKHFGLSFSSMIKSAMVGATALAGLKIVEFLKDTVKEARDAYESENKVAVVFGKSTEAVMEFGKSSATSMGMSRLAYMDAVGTLGNLFVALKLPGPQAATMAEQMTKLAGDLASFNNTSPADALIALKAGLVGQIRPLREYGVNITAATLQTEAMKLGLIHHLKTALNPAMKAQAAYALIFEQTHTAQGDFIRTSGGLANQQRILAAQVSNVKEAIGNFLLPTMVKLITFVTGKAVPAIQAFFDGLHGEGEASGFAGRLNEIGREIKTVVEEIRTKVIPILAQMIRVINDNRAPIVAFVATLAVLRSTIVAVAIATRAWAVIQTAIAFLQLAAGVRSFAEGWALLDMAMAANPIGIIVIAIAAFVAIIVLAYTRVKWFHDAVNIAWHAIQQATMWLWNNGIKPAFEGMLSAIQNFWAVAQPALMQFWSFIQAKVGPVISFLWNDIMRPAFNGMSVVVRAWWSIAQPVFRVYAEVIKFVVGASIIVLWDLMKVAWAAIVIIVKDAWFLVKAIFDANVWYIKNVFVPVFMWLWHNIIEPVWSGISWYISAAWNNQIKPVFMAIGSIISNYVAPLFKKGVAQIGAAWNDIKDFARTPVNFVIGTVINKGIIDVLNSVTGLLGHNANIGHLSLLAGGGVVRGPGTGTSDSILGLSAGGVPTARVSNGEYVVNAKSTARNIGLLHAINSGLPGFAAGGLLGAVGALTDPLKYLTDAAGIGEIVSRFRGNRVAEAAAMVPMKIIEVAVQWIKSHIASFVGSVFGGSSPGVSGSLGNWITTAMGITGVPASWFGPLGVLINRESGGNPNAINLTDSNAQAGYPSQGLMQTIPQTFAAYAIPGLGGITNPVANIVAGIRYIESRYGSIFNVQQANANMPPMGYANGGVINEQVWGVGRSGRRYTFGERGPETVTPGVGGLGGGLNFVVNIHGDVSDAHVSAIRSHVDDAFRRLTIQIGQGARR